MKEIICTAAGLVGAAISSIFGGWTAAMTTLLIFMAIDYISGLVVAGVFKKSKKTKNGALESKAGFKGICKKCMMLVFVLMSYRLDLVIGTNYIKDAVIIAFISNELISIIENAGLMGVKLPPILNDAIEMLQAKGDK